MFYVRIGGACWLRFFDGWCIRDLVLYNCVTGGGCVVTLTFVFFWAHWLDVLGLLFRTDKTIWPGQNVHFELHPKSWTQNQLL